MPHEGTRSQSSTSDFPLPRHPFLWVALGDYDGDHGTVGVPSFDDEHRPRAAELILDFIDPDWIGWTEHKDEVIAAVAPLLTTCTLMAHITEPYHEHDDECGPPEALARFEEGDDSGLTCGQEERCCGCEDIGWICEEGDGPPFPYFSIRRQAMDEAVESVRVMHTEDDDA